MTIKQFIERIGDLVGKDDLKTAIAELRNLLQKSKSLDEVIVHSARYNDLMKQIRQGTISFEDADIKKTKLRYAVLDMAREIETEIENKPELESEVDEILAKNATYFDYSINQTHSGTGDNVGRDKITRK